MPTPQKMRMLCYQPFPQNFNFVPRFKETINNLKYPYGATKLDERNKDAHLWNTFSSFGKKRLEHQFSYIDFSYKIF